MTHTDEFELLLARAIDRTADADDWRRLETRADGEPQVWEELGRSLRDDGLLRGEVAARLSVASRVELPARAGTTGRAGTTARAGTTGAPAPITPPHPSWRAWSGWAAALLLGLVWWASPQAAPGPFSDPGPAGTLRSDPGRAPVERAWPGASGPLAPVVDAPAVPVAYSGAEPGSAGAFDLSMGWTDPVTGDTIVGELPSLLLDTVPAPDGKGLDVVYVRRLVQRARVDSVYAMGNDDLGRARPVAVEPAVLVVSETF